MPDWINERPWRNSNPGDLRVRNHAPPWPGQIDIDSRTGGPFAIFRSRTEGWAAIGLWLFLAHDEWRWLSVRKLISAFAPPEDGNNTNAYIELVCRKLGVADDAEINIHDRLRRETMMRAIALAEAGPRVLWPAGEVTTALMMTELRWPAFLAAYRAPPPRPIVVHAKPAPTRPIDDIDARERAETERLNQAELDRIRGVSVP